MELVSESWKSGDVMLTSAWPESGKNGKERLCLEGLVGAVCVLKFVILLIWYCVDFV